MIENHTYQLEDFISELSSVSYSDILVHVNPENRAVFPLNSEFSANQIESHFNLPFSSQLNQIYKIALQYKKNSDVQSLCLVSHLFQWHYKNRLLETPLFLIPLHCKINKIKQEFSFSYNSTELFLNPFLINTLKKEFDLDLRSDFGDEKTLEVYLDFIKNVLDKHQLKYQIKDFQALGNFHHHRYEIVKDLEEILNSKNQNTLVDILLGNPKTRKLEKLNLSSKNCFATDTDQAKIFHQLEESNLVIQGPPGTGKSHVLANLISKLLLRDEKQLIVSEKKTALEVLEKKLQTFNLHHFAFVFHSQIKNGDFIKNLKNTWNFLENLALKEERNLLLSEQYKQQIQLVFDKLNQTNDFGNKSLFELQSLMKSSEMESLPYISILPTYSEWLLEKKTISKIYDSLKQVEILSFIQQGVFQKIENFDRILNELIEDISNITKFVESKTLKKLEDLNKKTIRFQIIHTESHKKYFTLLNTKNSLSKFKKLKEKYQTEHKKLDLLKNEISIWNIVPTLTVIESWKKQLEQANWFKKRTIKKEILKHLKNQHIDLKIALNNLKTYLNQLEICLEIESQLFSLGIENPETELNLIAYVLQQLSAFDNNELNEIHQLHTKEKIFFIEKSELIQKVNRNIKTYFNFSADQDILSILESLQKELPTLIALKEILIKLPSSILSNLKFTKNVVDLEHLILKSTWIKFSSMFPELANFNGEKLKNQLQNIISCELEEQKRFAEEICFKKQQKFQQFQQILTTPSVKLSVENKQLKKNLKVGKAILVKEFSKSKQHRSMRELFTSEASLWIDLLCPIHLCTPTMVSKNYPLSENLFECVIFDEASQLVLPKALSCVQRAKRLIIAGDSQQMSPSSFFAGKISSVDLLHQASYYFPNLSLKHHYRSKHAELIQFSNKHFYNNELIVYPSPNQKEFPLNFHYVENGIFENRENHFEAQKVAELIEKNLNSNKIMGIVAFSEQQLTCIWKKIHVKYHQQIETKLKKQQLFFKSLEQVQGEECDYLIISLAYGRDSSGKFHLRFGPLNQQNGSKRLNVLFTRAKEKIDFFSSVLSQDFEISTNESINLLRQYLLQIERKDQQKELVFPFQINPKFEGKSLKMKEIHNVIPNTEELKTFQHVMENRGWEVEYEV